MTTDERIAAIEDKIHTLQATQANLDEQLKKAHVEQWQGRIDDLQLQVNLAKTEGTERLNQMSEKLRGAWARTRGQVDDASTTASSVAETLRTGVHGAYTEVREALVDSKNKISR